MSDITLSSLTALKTKSGLLIGYDGLIKAVGLFDPSDALATLNYQSDLQSFRLAFENLQHHNVTISSNYESALAKLRTLIGQVDMLVTDKDDLLEKDLQLTAGFEKLALEVSVVFNFLESTLFRTMNLVEQQAYIESKKSIFSEYFSQLATKVAAYEVKFNDLSREYQDSVLELSKYDYALNNVNESLVSKSLKINELYRRLNDLNKLYESARADYLILSKKIAEMQAFHYKYVNLYCSTGENISNSTNYYVDYSSRVAKIESSFDTLDKMLYDIACNNARAINIAMNNDIDAEKFIDKYNVLQDFISKDFIVAGDNVMVQRDREGIFTVNINWPKYPKREQHTVQLPTPQLVLIEQASQGCPATCTNSGGVAVPTPETGTTTTTTTTTTAGPGETTTTTTEEPGTTPANAVVCKLFDPPHLGQFKLSDIRPISASNDYEA